MCQYLESTTRFFFPLLHRFIWQVDQNGYAMNLQIAKAPKSLLDLKLSLMAFPVSGWSMFCFTERKKGQSCISVVFIYVITPGLRFCRNVSSRYLHLQVAKHTFRYLMWIIELGMRCTRVWDQLMIFVCKTMSRSASDYMISMNGSRLFFRNTV